MRYPLVTYLAQTPNGTLRVSVSMSLLTAHTKFMIYQCTWYAYRTFKFATHDIGRDPACSLNDLKASEYIAMRILHGIQHSGTRRRRIHHTLKRLPLF
jgi:hypothetical protein